MKNISLENITKTYGEKELFREINFTIGENDRIGLIGVNGTGKSSLLKIVAGIDLPDTGDIIAPKDYSVSYAEQEPKLDEQLTIIEQVFAGDAPLLVLLREYEQTLISLNEDPSGLEIQDHLFQLQKKLDAMNGWEASTDAKTILTKLGITQFEKKIGELSGGQKKRVALAQTLIQKSDLLILDEPTNHLDHESVQWLEDYLTRYRGAILLVTHDRYFLDRVTNRMFELDGGHLYRYKGNYGAFLEAKAIREENEAAVIDKQRNLYRRELEWMRRGAKARTTKQKARIDRFDQLDENLSNVTASEKLDMSLSGSRLGKQVFELKSATKYYGNLAILEDYDLLVKPGDRLGIIGQNGTGKTTFLNILAGKIPLDQGERVIGQTVKVAYYTQESEELDETKRMIEYLKEAAEVIETTDGKTISAAQMLERFLFPPFMHGTLIRKLSGGEKRRLYLLKILMTAPNVLLLDEPTNNLDTQTLTVLEDYLESFAGVVITVSHDRYFLDKVATQLLVLQGEGEITSYYGNYSEYLEKSKQQESNKKAEDKKIIEVKEDSKPKKKKLSYNEAREWEQIDGKMEAIESRLKEIDEEMNSIGSDFEKAQQLIDEQTKLNEDLENLIERWTYLSEWADE